MTKIEIWIAALQFVGITLSGGLGVMALLKKSRDEKTGEFTKWGRRALIGAILSALVLLFIQVGGVIQKLNERAEADLSNQKQLERYGELLQQIAREARLLNPVDFQIRVFSTAVTKEFATEVAKPEPIHLSGRLGSGFFVSDLTQVAASRGGPRMRVGGSEHHYYYVAYPLSVAGIQESRYIDDLRGKVMSFSLPLAKLELFPANWRHQVDLYVKGRHFRGDVDAKGRVRISFEQIE
jgi:hypothetical protein